MPINLNLEKMNKENGQVLNADDLKKHDNNVDKIQNAFNNIIDYEQPITPTLINSWTDYGNGYSTVGYWKDSLGYVHLKGTVSSPSPVVNTIFTLPDGYKPLSIISFIVAGNSSWSGKSTFWTTIQILSNGSVNIGDNMFTSKVSLDGINFRVGV